MAQYPEPLLRALSRIQDPADRILIETALNEADNDAVSSTRELVEVLTGMHKTSSLAVDIAQDHRTRDGDDHREFREILARSWLDRLGIRLAKVLDWIIDRLQSSTTLAALVVAVSTVVCGGLAASFITYMGWPLPAVLGGSHVP